MATFETAFDWMMDSEDALRVYATVNDAPGTYGTDRNGERTWMGAHAIAGINSAAYPAQFAVINALPQEERAAAVASFYRTEFWNTWYPQIASDEVAKRVFDAAVNEGPATAVKILQEAVCQLGPPIDCDGGWGPKTIAAVNALPDYQLVPTFKSARADHYRQIVARNPADARYFEQWLERASR